MGNDGKIVIELVGKDLATQQFVRSLGEMKSSITSVQAAGTPAFSALGSAAMAAGTAILGLVSTAKLLGTFKEITEMEVNLGKAASRLGTTAEVMSGLGFVIKKTTLDSEAFYKALERMDKNVSGAALGIDQATNLVDEFGEAAGSGKAAGALRELGLNAQILKGLAPDQKLVEISRAFKENIAPADQARIAIDLFGKAGGGLIPVLKLDADAIQSLINKVESLGGTITTDMVKRAAEAKEAGRDLETAWSGFARVLVDWVSPGIARTLNDLTILVTGVRGLRKEMEEFEDEFPLGLPKLKGGAVAGVGPWGEAAEAFFPSVPPPGLREPPSRAKPEKAGAGGAAAGLTALMNQIDQLEKEYATFTEGQIGGIDKWAEHALNKIRGVEEVMKDPAAARARAEELIPLIAIEKKQKAELDYNKWLADIYHDTDYKIAAEEYELLIKHTSDDKKQKEIRNATAFKTMEERAKKESDIWGMTKGYIDILAGSAPLLTTQLALQEKALILESRISAAALEREIIEKRIPQAQADELRTLNAMANQAKKYSLERAKWSTEGVSGGVQLFAMDLRQESATAIAFGVRDGLKGAKGFADQAITDLIMSPFTHKKISFKQVGLDIATSLVSGMVKTGTTKFFSFFMDRAMGMVDTWKAAQAAMTGASLAGEAARLGAMASGASQGIGILGIFAKLAIFKDAGQAAAGGFKSVMESVPFPFNIALAPIVAAAAFAATLAFGSGGGGGYNATGNMGYGGPSPYHEGGHLQLIRAHAGWPLGPHEVPFIGLDTERVLSPRQTRDYEAGLREGGGSTRSETIIQAPTNIKIYPRQQMTQHDFNRAARMAEKALNRTLSRRGKKLGE